MSVTALRSQQKHSKRKAINLKTYQSMASTSCIVYRQENLPTSNFAVICKCVRPMIKEKIMAARRNVRDIDKEQQGSHPKEGFFNFRKQLRVLNPLNMPFSFSVAIN